MSGDAGSLTTCPQSAARKLSVPAPLVTITCHGWALHQDGERCAMARILSMTSIELLLLVVQRTWLNRANDAIDPSGHRQENIWSGKAQRSLRKKLFVSQQFNRRTA